MATHCSSVVDACIVRVAQLSTGGAPITGANHGYITDSQIKVDIALTLKTGAVFDQLNGCGQTITHVQEPDKVTGGTITLDLAKFDRELLYLMCGGTLFSSGSEVGGWQVPLIADATPNPVCIEVWSKAYEGSAVSVSGISSPNASYHCFVLPYVICTFQPFSLANGLVTFAVKGTASENTAITANGPFNDWPAWVAGKGGFTAVQGEFDSSVLPTAVCGRQSVPSGS